MSSYDYRAGKARLEEILDNPTEVINQNSIPKDDQFTYENGYFGWVSAIFVDIRDSTTLFQNVDKVVVSKVIRCFTSEVIEILRNDENLREIGIRGDCVYGIYSTPKKDDEYEVADKAFYINTYIKELNQLLKNRNYPLLRVGIGVSTAQELVVKAGRKNTGISNSVWIGKAVTTASNLSSIGSKNGNGPVLLSENSYKNIIERLLKENPLASTWFTEMTDILYGKYYSCNVHFIAYDNWISNGMLT